MAGVELTFTPNMPTICVARMTTTHQEKRVHNMTVVEEPTLGELIRRQRRLEGMSQDQLAELMGVNQSTVAKWERDSRPNPDRLGDLARFLGLSKSQIQSIYHGSDDDTPSTSDQLTALAEEMCSLRADLNRVLSALGLDGNGAAPTRRRTRRAVEPGA